MKIVKKRDLSGIAMYIFYKHSRMIGCLMYNLKTKRYEFAGQNNNYTYQELLIILKKLKQLNEGIEKVG